MARIQARQRGEEKQVELAYIQHLHEVHEAWLGGKEPGFRSMQQKIQKFENEVPVIYMNAEFEKAAMPNEYERCLKELDEFIQARGISLPVPKQPQEIIRFKKLSQLATIPIRATKQAAGLDLFSAENCLIQGNSRSLIKTDLAVQLPPGCYGRIAPRSGVSVINGLTIGAGVIDPDYTGPISVLLFNHSSVDYEGNFNYFVRF